MSEYLDRLKHLRDAKVNDGFNPPNVHANVSFRKAIDYIEKQETHEAYLLARLKEADGLNDVLVVTNAAQFIKIRELENEMRVQGELNEMDTTG